MKHLRLFALIHLIILSMLLSAGTVKSQQSSISVIHQDFSEDQGWEGINNRVRCESCPTISQNFGWLPGNHAGSSPGEIGGIIWRSTTPAYYAMPIGPLSFKEKFSASRKIAFLAPTKEVVGCYL